MASIFGLKINALKFIRFYTTWFIVFSLSGLLDFSLVNRPTTCAVLIHMGLGLGRLASFSGRVNVWDRERRS